MKTTSEAKTPAWEQPVSIAATKDRDLERAKKKISHAAAIRVHRQKHGKVAPAHATRDQYEAFSRAFDAFNEALFAGKCPPCVLTFQRKKGAFGYFSPERWEQSVRGGANSGKRVGEIALNPGAPWGIRDKGRISRDIASTLVHEMCHAIQHAHGKPSRSGYHNEEWAKLMESCGLVPSHNGLPGGKRTGQSMTHFIDAKGRFAEVYAALGDGGFLPFREAKEPPTPAAAEGEEGEGEEEAKPATDKKKRCYVCSSCGGKVWGKPGMVLWCAGTTKLDDDGCSVDHERHEGAPMMVQP